MSDRLVWRACALACFALACRLACAGQIATDGTLGPQRTLTGPAFSIRAKLGQQRGGNLFHSFTTFNLDAGESATFTGPISVRNVFARVTGGQPGSIDGTIACAIPNANFYLINPSGVMFGPEASLDVKGSFTVTTANTIKLGASGVFDVSRPKASVLATAPPAAFGFLSAKPAAISFNGKNVISTVEGGNITGTELVVPPGHTILVAGGTVDVAGTTLKAKGGNLELVAVDSSGTLTQDPAHDGSLTDTDSFSALGSLRLSGASELDSSGPGGGLTVLRGGAVTLSNAAINSDTRKSKPGQGADVEATRDVKLQETQVPDAFLFEGIFVRTFGSGRAGDITLSARRVTDEAGIEDFTDVPGSGPAGDITIHAKTVALSAQGFIEDATTDSGHAGNVTIRAAQLSLTGNSTIGADTSIESGLETSSTGHGGNIDISVQGLLVSDESFINAFSGSRGHAGGITISAGKIKVAKGGDIESNALSHGPGGDVVVSARTVSLVLGSVEAVTLGHGRGGKVSISAGTLSIDEGTVSAETDNHGDGGDVTVLAQRLDINNNGIIDADSKGAGNGGNVFVSTGTATLQEGGIISAEADSRGRGGNVTVLAHRLDLDFGSVSAASHGSGHGGNIVVSAGRLVVDNDGQIDSDTFGAGAGGDVRVTARSISINSEDQPPINSFVTGITAQSEPAGAEGPAATGAAGNLSVTASSFIDIGSFGVISTNSAQGGGQLQLSAGARINLSGHSSISATAEGDGGNIAIDTPFFVTLGSGSTITANAGVNGGNISIDPLVLSLGRNTHITANGGANGGNISIAATATPGMITSGFAANVTATGATGISGSVNAGPADSDIARSLAQLPAELQAGTLTFQPQCGQMIDVSTFLVQGRGSVATDPELWEIGFDLSSRSTSR